MRTATGIGELREMLAIGPRPVGLVPTMGALHEGHGRLIEEARRESAWVAVSLFVNPIQFNQAEDFERYPRPLEADLAFCEKRGADVVFAPSAAEMYPAAQAAFVEMEGVTDHMEGRFRPGHFRGVATVVMKLLQIVQPERAYFGEKDAQQLAVVRRMVRDLNVPVKIVGVPTVREADGLAMSSRNRHLSAEERRIAPVLYAALCTAARSIEGGDASATAAREAALEVIEGEPGVRLEYVEVADEDMQPVGRIVGAVRICGCVWVGQTRLIDNVAVRFA